MRDRAILAIVGAAALCGASLRFCDALILLRTGVPRRGSLRRARAGGVSGLRAAWIDEQVSLEVPASSQDAYSLYSDLRRQPDWSPWLKSVEHDREFGTSKWVIQSNGIKVSWDAKNTVEVYGSEVAWESTTGLSNRGRVTFQDKGEERCLMTLTLSYNLPSVIASVLRLEVVEKFVKRTILSDLSRFKKVLLKQLAEQSATAVTTETVLTAEEDEDETSPAGVAAGKDDAVAAGPVVTAAVATAPVLAPTTTVGDDAASPHLVAVPDSSSLSADGPPAGADEKAVSSKDPETCVDTASADSAASGSEGGAARRAPGRRARWRRRFRRLLRRDRGQDATGPPLATAGRTGAESEEESERGGPEELNRR